MGKQSVGAIKPERVREVIKELEAERKKASFTAIRERLGGGSYSTIAAVLTEWRTRAGRGRPSRGPRDARGAHSSLAAPLGRGVEGSR